MKKLLINLFALLLSFHAFAQDITGTWNGTLHVNATKKVVFVFHLSDNGEQLSTVIDIPEKRITGLKPQKTTFEEDTFTVDGTNLGIHYKGAYNAETGKIKGQISEGAMSWELVLAKGVLKEEVGFKANRPQEPVKPYPYYEEEVTFDNSAAGITLAGTLTLPKKEGKFPVAILISGSGPQDRDETFSEHKPFLVLADYLTRQGIAVLRYDDRGTAKSTGNYAAATTQDLATDAISAIEFLKTRKEIDPQHIGIIGHSEGGIIAPLVANQSNQVAFIVSLAGTGISGADLMLQQTLDMIDIPIYDQESFKKNTRKSLAIASATDKPLDEIKKELRQHYEATFVPLIKPYILNDEKINQVINQLIATRTNNWTRYFIRYNPADEYEKLTCPVLSLNGSKDVQVLAKPNQAGLKAALEKGNNPDFLIKEYEGLNHLFQECERGTMDEYDDIEQTISPIVLKDIATWILDRVK